MIRNVVADDGSQWDVFVVERLTSRREAVRDALADGWLCFQNETGHRVRVPRSNVPADWEKLPVMELLALMSFGVAAKPRTHL